MTLARSPVPRFDGHVPKKPSLSEYLFVGIVVVQRRTTYEWRFSFVLYCFYEGVRVHHSEETAG